MGAPRRAIVGGRRAARVRLLMATAALAACAASASVALSACSARVQRFELIFDPCAPLVLEPGKGAGEEETAIIEDAIELWGEVATIEARVAGDAADGARSLPVHFDDDVWYYGRFHDGAGHLEVASWLEDPDTMAIVLAHEIGHAYNLYHVDPDDRPSVMNAGNLDVPPTARDGQELRSLWGSCAARE